MAINIASLPVTITKAQEFLYDEFTGPLDDLLAAGLVRRDQLPVAPRVRISYLHGDVIERRGNFCRDETYLHVHCFENGTASVRIGVTTKIASERRAASRARRQASDAAWNAKIAAEKQKGLNDAAAKARRTLQDMPKSDDDFRRQVVASLRDWTRYIVDANRKPAAAHGYRLAQETGESIMLAADALVEAVMEGEVLFDVDLHSRIADEHGLIVRAADPSFYAHLSKLTATNPTILKGETS